MAKRLITAFLGILFALAVLFFAEMNSIVLNIAISLVTALMCYEFLSVRNYGKKWPYVILCCLFGFFTPFTIYDIFFKFVPLYIYIILFFLLTVIYYAKNKDNKELESAFIIFAFTTLITTSMSAFCYTACKDNKYTFFWALVFLAVPWLADSGAYFVGRFFGKHKLCEKISPHKTVEGAIGGIISGFIAVFIIYIVCSLIYPDTNIYKPGLLIIGLVCPVVSIIGDLTFSEIKRISNVKDYGNILPGHGGMLDRFDGVIFSILVVYIVANSIQII